MFPFCVASCNGDILTRLCAAGECGRYKAFVRYPLLCLNMEVISLRLLDYLFKKNQPTRLICASDELKGKINEGLVCRQL